MAMQHPTDADRALSEQAARLVAYVEDGTLTVDDVKAILDAAKSNTYAFKSKSRALSKMSVRRQKYSGGDTSDPYTNFKLVHGMMQNVMPGLTMEQTMMFYVCLKIARLLVSFADFEDERVDDTVEDASNYLDILGGWLLRSRSVVKTEFDEH